MFKIPDLYDVHLESLQLSAPVFRDFGGKQQFYGQIVTLMKMVLLPPKMPLCNACI